MTVNVAPVFCISWNNLSICLSPYKVESDLIYNGNSPNGDIDFKDAGPTGITNMRIDGTSGHVGIGTTSPEERLRANNPQFGQPARCFDQHQIDARRNNDD